MAAYNKLFWTASEVRCPFYISDDRRAITISCEGYADGVTVVSKFKDLDKKHQHMGKCCVKKFQHCPIYRGTYMSKYAD